MPSTMPIADQQFHRVAEQRNEERKTGMKNVRSVYGAKMPRFGHYKVN
jgi:hypothetical protein